MKSESTSVCSDSVIQRAVHIMNATVEKSRAIGGSSPYCGVQPSGVVSYCTFVNPSLVPGAAALQKLTETTTNRQRIPYPAKACSSTHVE